MNEWTWPSKAPAIIVHSVDAVGWVGGRRRRLLSQVSELSWGSSAARRTNNQTLLSQERHNVWRTWRLWEFKRRDSLRRRTSKETLNLFIYFFLCMWSKFMETVVSPWTGIPGWSVEGYAASAHWVWGKSGAAGRSSARLEGQRRGLNAASWFSVCCCQSRNPTDRGHCGAVCRALVPVAAAETSASTQRAAGLESEK